MLTWFRWGAVGFTIVFIGMLQMANAELNVGDQVPNFSLPGSDGKSYGPEDYKDEQVMVIAWFPKAFTGG
tara:strand:+ start:522 stop:731 length:210 start_codon:yes stop_codon:yes gene_type:complete